MSRPCIDLCRDLIRTQQALKTTEESLRTEWCATLPLRRIRELRAQMKVLAAEALIACEIEEHAAELSARRR